MIFPGKQMVSESSTVKQTLVSQEHTVFYCSWIKYSVSANLQCLGITRIIHNRSEINTCWDHLAALTLLLQSIFNDGMVLQHLVQKMLITSDCCQIFYFWSFKIIHLGWVGIFLTHNFSPFQSHFGCVWFHVISLLVLGLFYFLAYDHFGEATQSEIK